MTLKGPSVSPPAANQIKSWKSQLKVKVGHRDSPGWGRVRLTKMRPAASVCRRNITGAEAERSVIPEAEICTLNRGSGDSTARGGMCFSLVE